MRMLDTWKSIIHKGSVAGLALVLGVSALMIMPSKAWADWNFHPQCTGEIVTDPDEPTPPNILLMLDQSGSMNNLEDDYGNTLWEVAVEGYWQDDDYYEGTIPWVTNTLDDDIRFGLGLFPVEITECTTLRDTPLVVGGYVCSEEEADDVNECLEVRCPDGDETCIDDNIGYCLDENCSYELGYYYTEYEMCPQSGGFECDTYPVTFTLTEHIIGYAGWEGEEVDGTVERCTFRDGADEIVPSDYNNHATIDYELSQTYAAGGTPTWAAIDTMRTSESLDDDDYPSAGVLITDGNPCCHETARDDAIDAACAARDAGHTNYVLGLGGETDQDFNNKMAAAMGTGECSDGDPCTHSDDVDKESCSGAFHADNRTELQNRLLEIGGTFQCTFPVDTTLHPDPDLSTPEAFEVELLHNNNPEMTIDHVSITDDEIYWDFAGQDDVWVELSTEACNEIQNGQVEDVTTRLGCVCGDEEGVNRADGEPCTIDNPAPGECPEGTYECVNGYAQCNPLPLEECPVLCDAMASGLACHVSEFDLTLQEIVEGADPSEDLEGESNRCHVGRIECIEGADGISVPVCEQALNPMPELCDGLDNSCSGTLDDIGPSWDKWRNSEYPFHSSDWDEVMHLEQQWQGPSCNERSMCRCHGPGLEGPRNTHVGMGEEYDSIVEEFEDYLAGWSSDYCQCSSEIEP